MFKLLISLLYRYLTRYSVPIFFFVAWARGCQWMDRHEPIVIMYIRDTDLLILRPLTLCTTNKYNSRIASPMSFDSGTGGLVLLTYEQRKAACMHMQLPYPHFGMCHSVRRSASSAMEQACRCYI